MQSEDTRNSKTSSVAWITVLTAVGITATALVMMKRLRANSRAHVDDLFGLCDRAAHTLEERVGGYDIAYNQR